jgi:5-methylcytosine-specific restriction enzyme subunit McrC
LVVNWLADGQLEISATSWIGVVRFSNVDVRIIPKFVGGTLRVLRMIEYASGMQLLRLLPQERELPAHGDDLFDLICLLLVKETDIIVMTD